MPSLLTSLYDLRYSHIRKELICQRVHVASQLDKVHVRKRGTERKVEARMYALLEDCCGRGCKCLLRTNVWIAMYLGEQEPRKFEQAKRWMVATMSKVTYEVMRRV